MADENRFCTNCGAPVAETPFCAACGASTASTAAAQAPPAQSSEPSAAPRSRRPRVLITGGLVAVAVLLTIGGTLVWNVFSARAAEDAVDSAVEEGLTRWVKAAAGDAGQCVGMDDLIVSDGVSIEDDCEDMTGSVPDATVRRVNVGPVEFDGDRATAPVTMWGSYVPPPIGTGSENSTEQNVHGFQLRVRMIKHSGMWKIDWRD